MTEFNTPQVQVARYVRLACGAIVAGRAYLKDLFRRPLQQVSIVCGGALLLDTGELRLGPRRRGTLGKEVALGTGKFCGASPLE